MDDCGVGIKLLGQSDKGTYIGNTVLNCSVQGIFVDVGDYNSITANVITDCGDGIELGANASNNYITVNQITGSTGEDIDDNSDGTNYILDKATDINAVDVPMFEQGGAEKIEGVIVMNANDEGVRIHFYISPQVDDTKDITLTFPYQRGDAENDVVPTTKTYTKIVLDGTVGAVTTVWDDIAGPNLPAEAGGKRNKYQLTISAADITTNTLIAISWFLNDADGSYYIYNCNIEYTTKRAV